MVYLPWQQLYQHLRDALGISRRIAMQYPAERYSLCSRRELASSHRPIVAVNAHSADPTVSPIETGIGDDGRRLPATQHLGETETSTLRL
jgi:hypothetical protein